MKDLFLKDADILMKSEMVSVKGGDDVNICGSCCVLNNGGSSGGVKEN